MGQMKHINVGDVVLVENGARVYASIPARFIYHNRFFSMEKAVACVRVGAILPVAHKDATETKNVDYVIEKVKEVFMVNLGIVFHDETIREFVNKTIESMGQDLKPEDVYDTSYLIGEYVVVEVFEHGHHNYGCDIRAKKLVNGKYDVSDNAIEIWSYTLFTKYVRHMTPTFV